MKNSLLGSLIVVILLSLLGCQQITSETETVHVNNDMDGFVEPKSSDRVKYIKPIREYMYFRTQAVLNKDIKILWDKYPDLKENIDLKQGVNVEKYDIETLGKSLVFLDANFDTESYERIKVKTMTDNEVIVLVHGSIFYLMNDFAIAGGEHLIKIFLKQNGNDWTVVKTDEYTLPEYKKWLKER